MGESVQQSSTSTSLTSGVVEPLFSRNCSPLSEVQVEHNATGGGGGASAHLSTVLESLTTTTPPDIGTSQVTETLTTTTPTSTDIIGSRLGLVRNRVAELNGRSPGVAPISLSPFSPFAATSIVNVSAFPPASHCSSGARVVAPPPRDRPPLRLRRLQG